MSNNPFNSFGPDYLASLNNSYRDAKVRARGGGSATLPEGKYQAYINYVSLMPSKLYADELQLAIGFDILAGDQKGQHVAKYIAIIPERMEQLKNDLSVLNIDIGDDVSKLGEEETINQMIDQIVDITIRHKKKDKGGFFQNVYIDRSLGKSDNFVEQDDDDDNPFN